MLNTLSFQPLEIIRQIHEVHSSNDKSWPVYLNERANQELHMKEGLSFLNKWKLFLNSKPRTVNQSYSSVPHCPQEVNVGTQTSAILPCSRSSSHGTLPNVTVSTPPSAAPCAKRCLSQSPMYSVNISITGPASLHGSCYKALKKRV
jgi:hypothetical protein